MYACVSGRNYKLNTKLQACNSNIMFAGVSGPNYKLNTQLLPCN
jgi:hypothetical protein